jgi:hypothetical protein
VVKEEPLVGSNDILGYEPRDDTFDNLDLLDQSSWTICSHEEGGRSS